MAQSIGKVDWYGNDVLLAIEGASDEFLTQLAFQAEGYAKVEMNVDTGFMRNATYTIPATGESPKNTGWKSGTFKSKATGEMVKRQRVQATPRVPEHTAAVHCAAEYAIYQEMQKHALYTALEKLQDIAPGVIREVGRKRL